MATQQKAGIDAGQLEGGNPGITTKFLLIASLLAIAVPTALLFVVAQVVLVLLR